MIIKSETPAEELLRETIARLQKSYSLIYVGQGSQLSDEQIAFLLHGDYESLEGSLDEWDSDNRYDGVKSVVEDLLDEDEIEMLEDADLMDDLHTQIYERDDSDLVADLCRETHDVYVRYYIGDVGDVLDGDGRTEAINDIAETVGIDLEEELRDTLTGQPKNDNASKLEELIDNGWSGGLYVYWRADLSQMLDAIQGTAWRDEKFQITWTNPYLLIFDRMNGSGHCVDVKVTYTADLNLSELHLDKGNGSFSDWTCGGLYLDNCTTVEISRINETERNTDV